MTLFALFLIFLQKIRAHLKAVKGRVVPIFILLHDIVLDTHLLSLRHDPIPRQVAVSDLRDAGNVIAVLQAEIHVLKMKDVYPSLELNRCDSPLIP